jgi:hypothetical protein
METLQQWEVAEKQVPTTGVMRWRWLFQKRILPIAMTYAGLVLAPLCFSISGVVVAVFLLGLTGLDTRKKLA